MLYHEAVLLFLAFLLIAAQLFVQPIIGLADNGDFAKISGWLDLGTNARQDFVYFVSDYKNSPDFYRAPDTYSSEVVFAWIARAFAGAEQPKAHFPIQALGAVHTFVFLAGFYLLLRFLRRSVSRPIQIASALLYLWIFTDIMYVAYFNSFFTETTAILMLPIMITAALYAASDEHLWTPLVVGFVATLFFVTSKAQHTLPGIFPLLFLVMLSFASHSRARKIFGVCAALVLLVVMTWQVRSTPNSYSAYPLFNLLFVKVVPRLPDPVNDRKLLGLTPEDAPFVGHHAYTVGIPIVYADWRDAFLARTGYGRVMRLYIHHPSLALSLMGRDLRTRAISLRPIYLGNYRSIDKAAPSQMSRHFDSWSDLRGRFYRARPGHVVVWYLLFLAAGITLLIRSRSPFVRKVALLGLCLALMGIMEFSFASLMDAEETDRHLILFQEITDLTIWMAFSATLVWVAKRYRGITYR